LPVVISNCSNNYGPYQFPEKLIPLMIRNIIGMKNLPVYGDGKNTRDWLWVGDHVSAIDLIFHRGEKGETYAIGGHNEWQNLALVQFLCQSIDKKLGREEGTSEKLITFVTDRKGHDRRYAIDATKLKDKLGWEPQISPEEGMVKTVDWYVENAEWLDSVTSGSYQEYYKKQYQA
jgi:dTDP-glucose 4,6-dehydratase